MTLRIPAQTTQTLIDEAVTASGTTTREFVIESDTLMVGVWVAAISGTLDVTIATLADDGQTKDIITFPTLSGVTTELNIKKATSAFNRMKVTVVYSDAVTYNIVARSISGGASTTTISGVGTARTFQKDVTSTATLIIAAALSDRAGIIVQNISTVDNVFVGFANTVTTTGATGGYRLAPGEAIAADLAAGIDLYGISDGGTVDVRGMEAG